jgi:small-conductance mechanosensitive channel
MTAFRLIPALVLALVLGWVGAMPAAWAQTTAPAAAAAEPGPPDYKAWERTATRAESLTQDSTTPTEALTKMRGYVAEWRATFLAAQNVNSARIATLRGQISALGAPPAEGAMEEESVAVRRTELSDQLARLQAPVIAADEAYRRADGLIREIDRQLRERQASQLMELAPSPLNPVHWPDAAKSITKFGTTFVTEVYEQWNKPLTRRNLESNLPFTALYLAVALVLILRGRRLMDRLAHLVRARSSVRWFRVWSFFLSLGQFVLPALGVAALTQALSLTSMLGPQGRVLAQSLPAIGFIIFFAVWLGGRIFPKSEDTGTPLVLPDERRKEGRFHSAALGVLIALGGLVELASKDPEMTDGARSVLALPIFVAAGLLLVRIGQLMQLHVESQVAAGNPASFRDRLIRLLGRAAQVIGVVGPVLCAIGYVEAANALVFPAVLSLALIAMTFVVLNLIDDSYALLFRKADHQNDALAPTLIGFALTLATLPLFALIWGARPSDISELWSKFLEGVSIGETKISPTGFLLFLIVFGIGYMVTRLVQGALRSSVLPKTRLDQGGQTAILSGLGYVGVFLSGLIAINAAGINLSGLAIVAGALSVGIGFGLQNIVSNFVSGIILLIERPISEGDWIEVGGVQGIVQTISVRSTRIQTFDRSDVIVPNTDLIAGRVTNWTRYNLSGRLIIPVAVAHGADTRKVERILMEIAEAEPLAVLNPPPTVLLMGFTPDAVLFEIRMILRDVNFQLSVRSDINHRILQRFEEEGLGLPLSAAAQAQLKPPGDGS